MKTINRALAFLCFVYIFFLTIKSNTNPESVADSEKVTGILVVLLICIISYCSRKKYWDSLKEKHESNLSKESDNANSDN